MGMCNLARPLSSQYTSQHPSTLPSSQYTLMIPSHSHHPSTPIIPVHSQHPSTLTASQYTHSIPVHSHHPSTSQYTSQHPSTPHSIPVHSSIPVHPQHPSTPTVSPQYPSTHIIPVHTHIIPFDDIVFQQ